MWTFNRVNFLGILVGVWILTYNVISLISGNKDTLTHIKDLTIILLYVLVTAQWCYIVNNYEHKKNK